MESIDLQRFVSTGYFLIREGNPGWDQLKTGLLPEKLISLANCIAPRLSVVWGWGQEDKNRAIEFGVRPEVLDEFFKWCAYNYEPDMDFWSTFQSPDSARRIAKRFLSGFDNLHIIGAGVPRELVDLHWKEDETDQESLAQYGIDKRIDQDLPLVEGGNLLGFEVVTYEYGDFAHSMLCTVPVPLIHDLFGITPGQYGLLTSEHDARLIYDWVETDETSKRYTEPVGYDYCVLVEYPLDLSD